MMDTTAIYKAMKALREERYQAKKVLFTADEWSEELEIKVTPQRLAAMWKQGLVVREKNRRYYGDDKYRYDVI